MSKPSARELLDVIAQADDEAEVLPDESILILAARVERVLALHAKAYEPHCSECPSFCKACHELWPCPTVRLLDGDEP